MRCSSGEIRGLFVEGVSNAFLLMYGFCSNNAFYSTSLLLTMFLFLLTPVNTWDRYYFESVVSLVLLIKVCVIKRTSNFVLYSSKHEEVTFSHELIFVFIPYFVGVILSRKCQKCGGLAKKYDKGGRGKGKVFLIRGVVQISFLIWYGITV